MVDLPIKNGGFDVIFIGPFHSYGTVYQIHSSIAPRHPNSPGENLVPILDVPSMVNQPETMGKSMKIFFISWMIWG